MMAVPVSSKMSKANVINALPRLKLALMFYLGQYALLCQGVKIRSNVVIGAGCGGNRKSIPDNSVAIGVPAKVVSKF